MATISIAVEADTVADTVGRQGLETQVDAALSGLLDDTVTRFCFLARDKQRRQGKQYSLLITYKDSSTVSIVSPFKVRIFEGSTITAAKSLNDAFIAANPTYFFAAPCYQYINQFASATKPHIIIQFYSADPNAINNWGADGGGCGGGGGAILAGDVTGLTSANTVVAIRNKDVPTPTVGGTRLVYDSVSDDLVWYSTLIYTSLAAAAAAQANQIIGEQVIIFGSAGGTEDGTYRLTAKTGVAGDYTKISDATNTASEVGIVDAGGFYVSSDVEGALQELGPAKAASSATTVALASGANVVGNVLFASGKDVKFSINLSKGTESYSSTIRATHDGSAAVFVEEEVAFIPGSGGTFDFTVDIDDTAGIALSITTSSAGWTLKYLTQIIN